METLRWHPLYWYFGWVAWPVKVSLSDLSRHSKVRNFDAETTINPNTQHNIVKHSTAQRSTAQNSTAQWLVSLEVGVKDVDSTHMQFLAARSRWTSFFADKYAMPSATSWHILNSVGKSIP